MARYRRLWRRLPIFLKAVLIAATIGLAVWIFSDLYLEKVVRNLFEVYLQAQLEQQSQEDRLRFDHYMKNFHQVVRLTVSQDSFREYMEERKWTDDEGGNYRVHRKPPPWFLPRSALRSLASPRYAVLFDGEGRLLEIYNPRDDRIPLNLLRPSDLFLENSTGQTHIASMDEFPYMVAADTRGTPWGSVTLLIAAPIDDRLLLDTQGDFPRRLIGLVAEEGDILLTSNNSELLPPGTKIENLREKYVITGRNYHDYGGAEIIVRISSFVPTAEIHEMAGAFIRSEKKGKAVTALIYIACIAVLILLITRRIRLLTDQIEDFSVQALGGESGKLPPGDRLDMLAERFQILKKEVFDSHERIRRESEDHALRNMEMERQKRMLSLLISVTDAIGVGVMIIDGEKFIPLNDLMAAFQSQFGDLSVFAVSQGKIEERQLVDLEGSGRVFQVSSPALPTGERVVMINDLTLQKQTEAEKETLQSHLSQAQKMESIGRLAGGVAHDFNNILSAIIGYSELILKGLPSGDPLREKVTVILESGERAADLTGQLLAFSRKQTVDPKVMNLNTLLNNLQGMLGRIIGENIAVQLKVEPNPWNILADSTHMEQLIINLAVNARDAMPDGGDLVFHTENISVGEKTEQVSEGIACGDYVLLTARDTGTGISQEDLGHIFEPFFTTKVIGKGTGLGLATVYGIVKQSKGYIFAKSMEGVGTTFAVYLPRTMEKEAEVTRHKEVLPRGTETILLAEDQLEVRTFAVLVLSDLGYTVLEAGDGEEALEMFMKFHGHIDLLLSDVVMPKTGGIELSERIGRISTGTRTLLMTGYSDRVVAASESGERFQVLQKPLSASRLSMAVRKVLDS